MNIPPLTRIKMYKDKLSLNNYIFLVFLVLVFLASCCSIIGNILTNYPIVANIKWLFAIVLSLLGFYFLYIDRYLEQFKISVFSAVLFLVILPSWFYGGGDNTITLLYLLLFTVEAFLIMEHFIVKCLFALVSVIGCIFLLTITYHFPYHIQSTQDQNVYADSLIQLIIIFILSTVSIAIYTSRYRKQHDLLTTLNNRLEQLAITDELSQVYNRRKITSLLEELCGDERINSTYVVMVDIDSFKGINDTYGHIVGDNAIRHISKHLRNMVGSMGYVGRYGGDEFMLILCNMTDDKVKDFAQCLIHVPLIDKLLLTISGGIGKGMYGDCGEMIINKADEMLLEAKRKGKNNIQL